MNINEKIKYLKEEIRKLEKLVENYKYYKSQLNDISPVDEFGANIVVTSGKGKTKTMNINKDLVKAFNEFVKENKLD